MFEKLINCSFIGDHQFVIFASGKLHIKMKHFSLKCLASSSRYYFFLWLHVTHDSDATEMVPRHYCHIARGCWSSYPDPKAPPLFFGKNWFGLFCLKFCDNKKDDVTSPHVSNINNDNYSSQEFRHK